jgi:hypothetical protein
MARSQHVSWPDEDTRADRSGNNDPSHAPPRVVLIEVHEPTIRREYQERVQLHSVVEQSRTRPHRASDRRERLGGPLRQERRQLGPAPSAPAEARSDGPAFGARWRCRHGRRCPGDLHLNAPGRSALPGGPRGHGHARCRWPLTIRCHEEHVNRFRFFRRRRLRPADRASLTSLGAGPGGTGGPSAVRPHGGRGPCTRRRRPCRPRRPRSEGGRGRARESRSGGRPRRPLEGATVSSRPAAVPAPSWRSRDP